MFRQFNEKMPVESSHLGLRVIGSVYNGKIEPLERMKGNMSAKEL